jgi:pilus assembly protein CpaE
MTGKKIKGLNVVSVLRGTDKVDVLRSAFEALEDPALEFREGCIGDAAAHFVNGHTPDVLFVELGLEDESEIETLSAYTKQTAGRTVVFATAKNPSIEDVRKLMRAGVADFIPQPLKRADIMAALHGGLHAGLLPRESLPPARPRGRVISFLRCAGGVGATTLAIEAACDLQARLLQGSRKACYLDLDLQFGNAALLLDVEAKATVLNVVEHADGLDHTLLEKLFGRHRSGLQVLAAPRQVVPLDAMTPKIARKMLDIARQAHEVVFVDLPLAWSDWSLSILKESDLGIVVTGLTVPDLDRTSRMLDALRDQGVSDLELILVATRVSRFWNQTRLDQAAKILKRKIDFCVVKDEDTVTEAHDRGVLFSAVRRGTRIEKDVHVFADSLEARLAARTHAAAAAIPLLRM